MDTTGVIQRQATGRDSSKQTSFRSEAEAQIGRCLTYHGVEYLYEHPLAVMDRGLVRLWHPDYQLPSYGLVIEYGGRVDEPRYTQGWRHKQKVYDANGITALMLTPDDLRGGWPTRLLNRIEDTLEQRLRRFRAVRRLSRSSPRR